MAFATTLTPSMETTGRQRLHQYLALVNLRESTVPASSSRRNGRRQQQQSTSGTPSAVSSSSQRLAAQYHHELQSDVQLLSATRQRHSIENGDDDTGSVSDESEIFAAPAGGPPPPISLTALTRLPRYRVLPCDKIIHRHNTSECSICSDRLVDGIMLTRLPCGHIYHTQCIVPWLSRTSSCPTCRYELPTNSPSVSYEVLRQLKMKDRPTVSCQCRPGFHTCFFRNPTKGDDDLNSSSTTCSITASSSSNSIATMGDTSASSS